MIKSSAVWAFRVLIILIITEVQQVTAITQNSINCNFAGGITGSCAYNPDEQCGTTDSSSGGPISGDVKSLAKQILDNGNIGFDYGKSGPAGTQFQRLADGQKAQTDDGRDVDVQPIILITILHMAQSHKVNISALTDGSSHTAPTNPHGSGKAVDINIFDGKHTIGTDAVADSITSSAAEVLPSGARFGLGDNGGAPVGTKKIGDKTFNTFHDFPTHVHIDVVGLDQSTIDAAVTAAGGGNVSTPISSSSSSNACSCQNAGTTLSGNSVGEQVFNYFVEKHNFSNVSAAAVTGNLEVESASFTVIDGWGGGGGNYYGLAQWSRDDRYPKLVEFAGGTKNAAQLNYQLDFVWHELNNGYESTLKNLRGNSSLEDKAIFWGRHFEVAVNRDGSLQAQDNRIADATKWFKNAKTAGGNSDAGSAATVDTSTCGSDIAVGIGGYSSPFHSKDGIGISRIDEGVDYYATAGKKVPIYAMGNGEITIATDHSSFFTTSGGHADWITYKLTDGPAKGKYIYVSEACTIEPDILSGKVTKVTSSTHLCDMLPDSIETGWALNSSSQAAAAWSVYNEGDVTAYGVNFNELLVKLGAPSGTKKAGATIKGTLPDNWPKWQ